MRIAFPASLNRNKSSVYSALLPLFLLAFFLLPEHGWGQSVVVNEFSNAASTADEWVELVVVQNNLDMRGMIIKDFSSSMASDGGRQFTFSTNTLWSSVRAGTIIVLRNNSNATDVTTGGSDYNLDVGLSNTTYFTGSGGTWDISNTEMIMIKESGSGTAGITGSIHVLASGSAGTQFTNTTSAKLRSTTANSSNACFALNSNSVLSDFNGTDAAVGTGTIGTWNNANNQTWILSLRQSTPTIPVPPTLSAVTNITQTAMQLNWASTTANVVVFGTTATINSGNLATYYNSVSGGTVSISGTSQYNGLTPNSNFTLAPAVGAEALELLAIATNGTISSVISGLMPSTNYSYILYSVTSTGTATSATAVFTSGTTLAPLVPTALAYTTGIPQTAFENATLGNITVQCRDQNGNAINTTGVVTLTLQNTPHTIVLTASATAEPAVVFSALQLATAGTWTATASMDGVSSTVGNITINAVPVNPAISLNTNSVSLTTSANGSTTGVVTITYSNATSPITIGFSSGNNVFEFSGDGVTYQAAPFQVATTAGIAQNATLFVRYTYTNGETASIAEYSATMGSTSATLTALGERLVPTRLRVTTSASTIGNGTVTYIVTIASINANQQMIPVTTSTGVAINWNALAAPVNITASPVATIEANTMSTTVTVVYATTGTAQEVFVDISATGYTGTSAIVAVPQFVPPPVATRLAVTAGLPQTRTAGQTLTNISVTVFDQFNVPFATTGTITLTLTSTTTTVIATTTANNSTTATFTNITLVTSGTYNALIEMSSLTATNGVVTVNPAPSAPISTSFETSDTWGILAGSGNISTATGGSDSPANQRIRTGSRSWQVNNGSATLDMETVLLNPANEHIVRLRVSGPATINTNGLDGADYLRLFLATNGAALPGTSESEAVVALNGNSNARWGYNATLVTTGTVGASLVVAAPQGAESTNNYGVLQAIIPAGATSVAMRVLALNNATSEIWCLDDIEIVVNTPPAPVAFINAVPGGLNFGNVVVGSTATQMVNVTWANVTTAIVVTAPVGYTLSTNGAVFTDIVNIPNDVMQPVQLNVRFSPTVEGASSGTITLVSGSTSGIVSVTGNGIAAPVMTAFINAVPGGLNFGNVVVGSTATQLVNVTWANVTTAIVVTAPVGYTLSTNGAVFTQDLNIPNDVMQPVQLNVRFSPMVEGASSGTITLVSGSTSGIVSVTGNGIAAPVLTAFINAVPGGLNFGNVTIGSTATQMVNVTWANVTTAIVVTAPVGYTLSTNGAVFTDNINIPHDVMQPVQLNVRFSPTVEGASSGTITFVSGSTSGIVSVTGNGIAAPVMTAFINAVPGGLNFGNVTIGSTATQLVNVTWANVTTAIVVTAPVGYTLSTNGAVFTQDLNIPNDVMQPVQLSVRFSPTVEGASSGTITLVSGSTSGIVSVTGNGIAAPVMTAFINAVPGGLNFGNVVVGSTATQMVNVTWANVTTAIVVTAPVGYTLSTNGAVFTDIVNIPHDVMQPVQLNVRFSPTVEGASSGTITLVSGSTSGIVSVTGNGIIPPVTQVLTLTNGWNMVSASVSSASMIMPTLITNANIFLVKDNAGVAFIPSLGVNNLTTWNNLQGYQIYTTGASTISFTGNRIPSATPIPVAGGWNLVGYLPVTGQSVPSAVANIVNDVILVKNNNGQIYSPIFNINAIGNMMPGQGYQVYMTTGATLVYPAGARSVANEYDIIPEPTYFTVEGKTGVNATVFIKAEVADGTEVGVVTKRGDIVGAAVFQNGIAAVTIWGASNYSNGKGAVQGEELTVRLAMPQGETPALITGIERLDGVSADGTFRYNDNAIMVLNVAQQQMTSTSALSLSPNPAKEQLRLGFTSAQNGTAVVRLISMLGNVVAEMNINVVNGVNSIQVPLQQYAAGMYMVELLFANGARAMATVIVVE